MKYEIIIRADTNDADYVTSINTISEEDLNTIKPLIEAIKNFKPYKRSEWTHSHNFPYSEYTREDLGEKPARELYNEFSSEVFGMFEDIVPYGEYGIHTIESITITPFQEKTKLL